MASIGSAPGIRGTHVAATDAMFVEGAFVTTGARKLVAADSPYAVAETNHILVVDTSAGDVALTLPLATALGIGFNLHIKKVASAGAVTLSRNVDGASLSLTELNESVHLITSSSQWLKLAHSGAADGGGGGGASGGTTPTVVAIDSSTSRSSWRKVGAFHFPGTVAIPAPTSLLFTGYDDTSGSRDSDDNNTGRDIRLYDDAEEKTVAQARNMRIGYRSGSVVMSDVSGWPSDEKTLEIWMRARRGKLYAESLTIRYDGS